MSSILRLFLSALSCALIAPSVRAIILPAPRSSEHRAESFVAKSGDPRDLLQFVTTPMPDEERAPFIPAIPMTLQEWQEEKAQEQWWSNLSDPRGGHYAAAITLFSPTAINSLPHAVHSTCFIPHGQSELHS